MAHQTMAHAEEGSLNDLFMMTLSYLMYVLLYRVPPRNNQVKKRFRCKDRPLVCDHPDRK